MKPKKFTKKLNLNKKTVVNLDHGGMDKAQAGIGCTIEWTNCLFCTYTCASCPTICGTCDTNDTIDPQGACCCANR